MSSPNNQPLLDVYANNWNRMLTLIPVPLCTTSCISYFQGAINPNTLTPTSAATHSKDCLWKYNKNHESLHNIGQRSDHCTMKANILWYFVNSAINFPFKNCTESSHHIARTVWNYNSSFKFQVSSLLRLPKELVTMNTACK